MPRLPFVDRDQISVLPRRIVLAALLLTSVLWQSTFAQEAAVVEDIQIGFDGEAQVGHWIPIRVVLGGKVAGARIEVSAPDGDGLETIYREKRSDSKNSTRFVYVKLGRRRGKLSIRVLNENGKVDSESSLVLERDLVIHASTRESILCLYPPKPGRVDLDELLRRLSRSEDERPIAYYLDDPESLPDEWFGYAGIDRMFVTTSDSGMLDKMTARQRNALEMWVRLGGRLIICVGERAADVAKLSSIRELLPAEPTEIVTQQRAVGMEQYVVQSSEPLSAYQITLFGESTARVLASEQSLTGRRRPVIMKHSHGMGVVTTVATDLDKAPFSDWESRSEVLLKLFRLGDADGSVEGRQLGAIGRVSHIGYEDLSGQLRSLLDRFAGPDGRSVVIAFSPVAACLAFYILLIAPGDYFFLRRLIGRMELTWITFPLIVLLACGAVLWASAKLKGDRLAVNQFDVIDFDHSTSTMRGYTWASVYSPHTASRDIELNPQLELSLQEGGGGAQQEGRLLTWMGLPGRGLGGLNSSTAAAFDAPYAIEIDEQLTGSIHGMPIAVSSTKQLSGVWWRTRVDGGEVNLVRKREYVQGEFANPFPVEIRDGLLFYNDWVYALRRRILPKQTVSIAEMEEPRDLVWRLTRRRVIDSKSTSSYENTPWNPNGESPSRLLEMISLYEYAGGQAYTQLSHRYIDHVDLSEHLTNGRAVFIGRVDAPIAELTENGKPLDAQAVRWTYCRAIFPVAEPTSE